MNRIAGYECENRQVLHTACRDIFSDEPVEPVASSQAKREVEKLKTFLEELDFGKVCNGQGEPFTAMVHIGIGGSDLGPRSIFEALLPFGQQEREVYFISNVDPDAAAAVLRKIDLSRTLVNVVSKSGTTLETLANETFIRRALAGAGLVPSRHCIAVTREGSPMDNPENYLRSFYMYDYIGGRYSATSMVGGVMLGFFLGFEQAMDFLRGASLTDSGAENPQLRENIPLLLAMLGVWNHIMAQSVAMAIGQKNDNPNRNFPGNRPNSVLLADRLTPSTMGAFWHSTRLKLSFKDFCGILTHSIRKVSSWGRPWLDVFSNI